MLDKLISNRTTILKNALSIMLLILILIVEGCFEFLDFTFSFDKLTQVGFWSNIAFKVLLLILVKMWVLSIFIDVARKKNVELDFQKKFNNSLMETKDNNFPKWVENVENKAIKIEFYKRKMNNKLIKLEQKAPARDRMLFFSDREDLKATNEYCIKRKEIEWLMSDEYIENNYQWLDIKEYPQIDSAIFDCPIGNENVAKKYQLSAKTKTAIITSLLSACIVLIFFQTFWNSLVLSKNELSFLVIISSLLMDFIFIIWQGLTGISSAFNIIDTQEVLPYVNRNRILEKYLYFKNPNDEKVVRDCINNIKKECRNGKEQK